MTSAPKWLPGVALIAFLAAGVVSVMTAQSRLSIRELRDQAVRLAQDETRLIKELEQLRLGSSQIASLDPKDLWRADANGSVEVQIQQTLVDTSKRAGLTLASFGTGAPLQDMQSPTLSYDLELAGPHESVARFMADLERQRPALAISYLWLRQMPVDPTQPGSPVQMRISVWGFVEAATP